MNSVCVFCGSALGADSAYSDMARKLGALLAEQGLDLVYGGGSIGLMGALANATLAGGGRVIGVIPRAMAERELAHGGLAEQHIVGSMHERKQRMAELADGFVALPGGWGTLDELCEMMTWAQLGIHFKPVGLLNVSGYYEGFLVQLARAERERLIRPEYRSMLLVDADPAALLQRMGAYRSPRMDRAADRPRP
ncbi:MAG: TIGR00730 family Rossman fold protein [SAR324 cluster bacterium]